MYMWINGHWLVNLIKILSQIIQKWSKFLRFIVYSDVCMMKGDGWSIYLCSYKLKGDLYETILTPNGEDFILHIWGLRAASFADILHRFKRAILVILSERKTIIEIDQIKWWQICKCEGVKCLIIRAQESATCILEKDVLRNYKLNTLPVKTGRLSTCYSEFKHCKNTSWKTSNEASKRIF